MGKRNRHKKKILYMQTNEIALLDIPRALDELGHEVYRASLGVAAQEYNANSCELVLGAIRDTEAEYVISYDFVETIAHACYKADVPYIAWVYDAPQKELYTDYALLPSNYVFVFDKKQRERLKSIGIKNVYYMPLAIHANKVNLVLDKKKGKTEYSNEIGFVGQLYRKRNLEKILEEAPEPVQEAMEQCINNCYLKWDEHISMHETMPEECVQYYSELDQHRIQTQYPHVTEQFYYEAAVLSRILANRERVHILNTLAEKHDVALYTFDKDTEQISTKVKVLPGAKYDYEVSNIYCNNKINLNITLHCIETGASQRIFDVMAAGGFMMSNYQQALAELFIPGEEIVLYHDMQELEELVEYYLTHDEERERIARKGQEKVLRLHNYHEKMDRIIQLVDTNEEARRESYVAMKRRWLREQANKLLAEKTDEAYQKLYKLYINPLYDTEMRNNTALGTLREMLHCWSKEKDLLDSHLFDDIYTLEQAEEKYLIVKHGMWRIEQGLSEEACRAGCERFRKDTISKYFLVWVVRANLEKKTETYLGLAQYFAEYSIMEALEVLMYALLFYPNDNQLLLQKADYMMELGAWKEALETLWVIEDPDDGVCGVIEELENALGMRRSNE